MCSLLARQNMDSSPWSQKFFTNFFALSHHLKNVCMVISTTEVSYWIKWMCGLWIENVIALIVKCYFARDLNERCRVILCSGGYLNCCLDRISQVKEERDKNLQLWQVACSARHLCVSAVTGICFYAGKKPYICSVCGKSFTQKIHAKEHELQHSEKKRLVFNLACVFKNASLTVYISFPLQI